MARYNVIEELDNAIRDTDFKNEQQTRRNIIDSKLKTDTNIDELSDIITDIADMHMKSYERKKMFIDRFGDLTRYALLNDSKYSYKETQYNKKSSYAVIKNNYSKDKFSDIDVFYELKQNIRHKVNSQNIIEGYLLVKNRYSQIKYKDNMKIKGIVDDRFPLYRKKRTNWKIIGYLEVAKENDITKVIDTADRKKLNIRYIAVVKEVSLIPWVLAMMFAILAVIAVLNNLPKNIDFTKFKPYNEIRKEETSQNNKNYSFNYNNQIKVNNGTGNLLFSFVDNNVDAEELSYIISIIVNDETVFKSELLDSSEELLNVDIDLPSGDYSGILKLSIMKNDTIISEADNNIEISVE